MYSTLDTINKLADERLELYRLGGQRRLTGEQLRRIKQINFELPGLWDQHRRDVAAARNGNRALPAAGQQRAA